MTSTETAGTLRVGRIVKTLKTGTRTKTGARGKILVALMNKMNWQQTENTGINTLGIIRKMGNTWRWVETSTKTGETDQF